LNLHSRALIFHKAENQIAESSNGRIEDYSRKINLDTLCNVRPLDFGLMIHLGLLKNQPRFFGLVFFGEMSFGQSFRSHSSLLGRFVRKLYFSKISNILLWQPFFTFKDLYKLQKNWLKNLYLRSERSSSFSFCVSFCHFSFKRKYLAPQQEFSYTSSV
jgi:hypothetical protein